MKNNLLTLCITVVVGIILVGSMLMPVISNAHTQNDVTYSNNVGNHQLLARDDSGSHTFSWTAGTSTYTFDGETYQVKNDCVITTDKVSFVAAYSSGTYTFLCYIDPTTRVVSTTYDINITMDNGVISGTVGTTRVNQNYSWAYVPSETGDYFGTYGSTGSYYVTSINDIVANYNYTAIMDGTATYKGVEATINDTLTPVANVYTIASDGLKVTSEGSGHAVNAFLVPVSVTYHDPTLDSSMPLLNAIPIVVILSLIVMLASALIIRRSD